MARILRGLLAFSFLRLNEAVDVTVVETRRPDFFKFIKEKQTFFEQHYFFDADDTMTRSLQVATEDVVDIQYSNLTWIPPLDLSPPGAFGGACLYAGTNYTSWRIHTDKNMTDNSARLRVVRPNLQTPGAPAGHCLIEEYNFVDVVPPLDGSVPFRAQLTEVWYMGGITFSQGGQVKLCLSPLGTFADPVLRALGDAALVPDGYTEYRILGAMDSCPSGPGCLSKRRFFCHLPHQYYTRYIQTDLECDMFLQATSSPLLYSRMAVMDDVQCGRRTGMSMLANAQNRWERIVDPITLIELGSTRDDQMQGFHYLLCFCPAFDASEGIFPVIDGVCGQFDDFVQQVGVIDGLMTTFLDVDSVVVEQVVPMTRFTIRVDCGGGFDSCDNNDFSSIKVIPRSWSATRSTIGYMHWNTSNSCPEAVETTQWYSPENCLEDGVRRSEGCKASGGSNMTDKVFGYNEIKFLPKVDADNAGVAQFFDICFVHKDPGVDGLNIRSFEPYSDAAMQETTRTFFKVGQLVVEPIWLYGTDSWVMTRPNQIRLGPPDLSKSSNLHGSLLDGYLANGTDPMGPMIKVILEDQTTGSLDAYGCFGFIPNEASVAGVYCTNRSWCTPRATKVGEELVLDGGNPDHRITVLKAGVTSVCYCEAWPADGKERCNKVEDWILVGKFLVSGPRGNQEWTLDTGMVQSLEVEGWGLRETNTIRVLEKGQSCRDEGFSQTAIHVKWCSARNKGICVMHGQATNDTSSFDLPGILWRHNSTDPPAYIYLIEQATDGRGTFLHFPVVPVIRQFDTIVIEENVVPQADHWVRQRDLQRILRGQDTGHQIIEMLNADRTLRIEMVLDPFPQLIFTPPQEGRWYRNNKIKVPDIKGTEEVGNLAVCWGERAGEYYSLAGFLSFVNPNFLHRITLGLTTTAAGHTAPVILNFVTGDNPQYYLPQNSMQLRITFTNSSILAPAFASFEEDLVTNMTYADQMHEASQSVCGRLFLELYTDLESGFPVPIGCYVDTNRYGSEGRVIAIYVLFEALNGLKAQTSYTIVMKAKLMHPMSLENYAALEESLIEVVTLDDIKLKPEGVVDVGYVNPDKPIQTAADRSNSSTDMRWYQGGRGGIYLLNIAVNDILDAPNPATEDAVLNVSDMAALDEFGLRFVIRGEENGKITQSSLLRIYLWPMTVWDFNIRQNCQANCVPHYATSSTSTVDCKMESAMSLCEDFVPPLLQQWVDTRGRACDWYAQPGVCATDGEFYTPSHGYSAKFSCCVCEGGVRSNANIIRLRLPNRMDPAFTSEVMHTIRFYGARPLPTRGFFPMRMGAQISTSNDGKPDYTTVAGRMVQHLPPQPSYASVVGSLVGVEGWGNTRQFNSDTVWNDMYIRMQMPLTVRGLSGGDEHTLWRSTGHFEIVLPPGYQCMHAERASGPADGENEVQMPWLPITSPQGKGMLPGANVREGGNTSAPGVIWPTGDWEFVDNKCIFYLTPDMTLYDRQRLYLYIWALNPTRPMPRDDALNVWQINFRSAGDWGLPANHEIPCQPLLPPFCNDTGEMYWVNPMSFPILFRDFTLLYPNYTDVEKDLGPYNFSVPTGEDQYFVTNFAVLGVLKQTVAQPPSLVLGSKTTLQLWFVAELGADRGGFVGVHSPGGFEFQNPCFARHLPQEYYSSFGPPGFDVPQRVWPLEDMGTCALGSPPSWHPNGNYAMIKVAGSVIANRLYGLEIDIELPRIYLTQNHSQEYWAFHISVVDGFGFGRDSTFLSASFQPDVEKPWDFYQDFPMVNPIPVKLDMLPFAHTSLKSVVDIGPISLNKTIMDQFRITAPFGYRWAWNIFDIFNEFLYRGLPGQTADFPGAVPPFPDGNRPHVIVWPTYDTYVQGEAYYLRTLIEIPAYPRVQSPQAWWFEWGFNRTGYDPKPIASSTNSTPIRALRNGRIEASDTVRGHNTTIWLFIELITRIEKEGSLEVVWPYHGMEIDSYPEWIDEVRYSSVRCATELGSMPAPPSLKMRYISFISALEKLGDWLTPPLGELRLELRANTSGFDPGLYIFEINATNPPMYADNPAVTSSPCKWKGCLTWYSKSEPFVPVLYNPLTMVWTHDEQPVNMWQKQYDYRTSVKAHQISDPMYIAAIVNLTLDERLACGRDDRPLRRSAVVIGFALNNYVSRREEIMEIRAPIGWLFDSDCSVKTEATEVYPPPAERPTMIALVNNTPELPVHNWPSRARIIECRGDQHLAHVRIGAGLDRRRVYLFLIELKQNPANTPIANTWSLALGSESSGAMDGFPVWTFPGVRIEPVLLAWTNKTNPVSMPVAVFFETTNWLFYFEPPLTPLSKLAPILRIVMPSQYEFLVEAEDQDMQGERCFMSMQQEGSCRLCGVPFLPNEAWCIREWNRKNAAEVHFLPSKIIEPLNQYSIWVVVTNPHSPDAIDAPVSTWLMETFFGEPVPPAVAPFGYWLDYVVAPGYRVSGLSELTVETPEARDGGSFVDWVTFTMRFPDLLLPGDYIEIKAPPGYQLSYLQPGFQLVVLCYGFRWIPTIWPDPLPPDVDPETVPTHLLPIRPPERPPVPEGVPTWASGNSILEVKPTELTGALQWAADGAWVMRMPINFTAAILDDYNNFLELIDGNDSNFSNLTASDYVTPGGVELMRRIGLPDWAVPAAARSQLETMGNDTVNASTEYLVLRSHCLKQDAQDGGGNYLNDDFNWSKVPASADFQVFYDIKSWVYHNGSSVGVPETFNFTYFVLSKNLTEPNNVSNMTNESAGISYVDEIHLCFRALFPASRSEIDGLAAESFCLQNCTGNATETECILDCLFTPIARNVTRCDTIPVGGLPEGAVNVAQELLPVPGCAAEVAAYEEALASGVIQTAETTNMSNSSNSSNQTGMQNLTAPVCKCGLPTDVFMAVVWKSKVNLTKEVEDYRLEYEAAVRLRSLDTSPLQAPAECDGNKVTFNINAEDMHPDPQFVNSTVTFRFQMRFTNPRRPPLDYENNWIMLHSREVQLATAAESQNAILSSDAVQSWNVRSKLRYISIERLTEVLRPEDTAEIHFEFVTVNVADQLVIQAVSPPGFDFTSVYLSSEGTDDGQKPPNVGRRLLWQGFTSGITVQDGYRNECTLRVNFDKNEYVRFRLAGVRIPWTGGQALFTMYTTIVGQRQDEIELCCHAGEPPENPANVFQVPYRLQGLRGVLQSEWDQEAFNFPIASSMKTRLDEQHLVTFTFMVAENIILPPQANHMVIIVRAPVGYNILLLEDLMDVRDSSFLVEDLSATNGEGLRMRSLPFVLDLDESTGGKVQVSLPGLQSMSVDLEYRILFQAYTPSRHAVRVPNDLWVVEATDDYKLAQNQVAPQKGSLDDFELLSKVNFTVTTAAAPPEVVIVLEVTLFDLGEASEYPNRVDVYAPAGYKFLLNCFAPGERERLKKNLVSCRERWTLFNGNYLSGAILMAADNGVLPSDMPMTIKLLANTPPLTPERNYFFTVTKQREGDAGWGMTLDGFPVTPMPVTIRYTGVAGAEVPLFLALQVRYPLEWGGHIHIAAPLEYQIRCPISKVLLAPDDFRIPNCTHTDPVLNGCFGLPLVGSSDPNPLLPLCDPLHEILLTFEMPWWSTLDPEDFPTLEPIPRYALEGSTELLWSITVKVPDNTPKIRSNNVFRVRVMDANKVAVDGNLWLPGETVRTIPRVQDFKIWFTQPVPASMMTVAIHFTFNRTLPRGQESAPLRVIEIVAPEGIELKVRRPKDVQRLKSEDYVAVTEWNWTDILPRQLWFGLDPNQNVTGTFHYAFPALTPPDPPGMPYDNLWQVRLCTDSPLCSTNLLSIPIPGFFFGEEPLEELSEEAQGMLTGGWAIRATLPSLSLLLLVVLLIIDGNNVM